MSIRSKKRKRWARHKKDAHQRRVMEKWSELQQARSAIKLFEEVLDGTPGFVIADQATMDAAFMREMLRIVGTEEFAFFEAKRALKEARNQGGFVYMNHALHRAIQSINEWSTPLRELKEFARLVSKE